MRIGISELIIIFIVALVVIGPDKLPEFSKKMGEAVLKFRKYSEEVTKDIKESIAEPLEEAQKPLQEIDREVKKNVQDVKETLSGIGKPKKENRIAELKEIQENGDTLGKEQET